MDATVRHQFANKLRRAIEYNRLLRPGAPVLVAVSGGADSVALLSGLLDCGFDCVAAHCNFHLRGAESMRDMRFVESLCARLAVNLFVRDFDVAARTQATGESTEMACRSLRYAWFDSLIDRERAQAIAVGHHREDNVETFMLNLLRGTGPAGLCGMRPRNGCVVRPLLDFTRAEIESYLEACGLSYIVDSSNASDAYRRNRLRNTILPTLEDAFPGAVAAIERTMANISDSQLLYTALVDERSRRYLDGSTIQLGELIDSEQSPIARMLLFEMLKPEGFNMAMVDDILKSANRSGLTFRSPQHHTRELSRGRLTLRDGRLMRAGKAVSVKLLRDILTPVHITVERVDVSRFRPERNANVAYFDARLADGEALTLRPWQRGDRIEPFGMNGSRLVSDLFSDAKYSAEQKRRAWLLCQGDTILWVVGLRSSRHFAVGPGTKEFIKLTFVNSAR